LGHEAKWEYFRVMDEPYRKAEAKKRRGLLNEFCLTRGYNRKCPIRLLNGPPPGQRRLRRPRGRKPRYGKQVVAVLTAVWEAAGRADLTARNWIVPVASRERALT